jgi:hypothetical protein
MELRISMLLLLLVTQSGLAQSPIDGVQSLYQWYLTNPETTKERLDTTTAFLQPELRELLKSAYQSSKLDFDPFVNAQKPARTFAFTNMTRQGSQATVKVQAIFDSGTGPEFDVILEEQSGVWLVADIKFANRVLKSHLQSLLVESNPFPGLAPELSPADPIPAALSPENLLGTWLHVSSSETLGGEQKQMAPVEVKWTFRADGRGEFSQKIAVSGQPWIGPLDWSIKGDTIMIGGGRTQYTVVRPGKDTMVWKNQKQGNYYTVRRLQDS